MRSAFALIWNTFFQFCFVHLIWYRCTSSSHFLIFFFRFSFWIFCQLRDPIVCKFDDTIFIATFCFLFPFLFFTFLSGKSSHEFPIYLSDVIDEEVCRALVNLQRENTELLAEECNPLFLRPRLPMRPESIFVSALVSNL